MLLLRAWESIENCNSVRPDDARFLVLMSFTPLREQFPKVEIG
jgi:hypothetical protein